MSPSFVHYLPIATTVLAAIFTGVLLRQFAMTGSGPHLLWWAVGIACYGLGTALESAITLWGNSGLLNRLWYAAGALLGAYPLAQGTVWLLLRPRQAWVLTCLSAPVVVVLAALAVLSPANASALAENPHRPSGAVLEWQWLRTLTPLVNGYAVLFLVGGAVLSAWRYSGARALGNALIAVGAILPGIGGGLAKAGIVEALYVGELVGLLLIWAGYEVIRGRRGDRLT